MFTDYAQVWDVHRVVGIVLALCVFLAAIVAVVVVFARLRRAGTLSLSRRVWVTSALLTSASGFGLVLVDIDARYVWQAGGDVVAYQVIECGSALEILLREDHPSWSPADGSRPRDACEAAASGRLPLIVLAFGASLAFLALAPATAAPRKVRDPVDVSISR